MVGMVGMGRQLESVISEVFSNIKSSVISMMVPSSLLHPDTSKAVLCTDRQTAIRVDSKAKHQLKLSKLIVRKESLCITEDLLPPLHPSDFSLH